MSSQTMQPWSETKYSFEIHQRIDRNQSFFQNQLRGGTQDSINCQDDHFNSSNQNSSYDFSQCLNLSDQAKSNQASMKMMSPEEEIPNENVNSSVDIPPEEDPTSQSEEDQNDTKQTTQKRSSKAQNCPKFLAKIILDIMIKTQNKIRSQKNNGESFMKHYLFVKNFVLRLRSNPSLRTLKSHLETKINSKFKPSTQTKKLKLMEKILIQLEELTVEEKIELKFNEKDVECEKKWLQEIINNEDLIRLAEERCIHEKKLQIQEEKRPYLLKLVKTFAANLKNGQILGSHK